MVRPARDYSPSRHTSQGHWGTQASPPQQGDSPRVRTKSHMLGRKSHNGTSKTKQLYQSTLTCLCFGSPTVPFASKHVWLCAMWPDRTTGLFWYQIFKRPISNAVLLFATLLTWPSIQLASSVRLFNSLCFRSVCKEDLGNARFWKISGFIPKQLDYSLSISIRLSRADSTIKRHKSRAHNLIVQCKY